MTPVRVRVTGTGTVELPGYGTGDAEHRVEKEIHQLDPGATVQIVQLRRMDSSPRIVEEFAIGYQLLMTVELSEKEAGGDGWKRAAWAAARQRLAGSRFGTVEWKKAEKLSST